MRRLLNFSAWNLSTSSVGLTTLSAAAVCLSAVGCGSASIATPVQAASPVVAVTTVPVASLAAVAVAQTPAKGDWGSIKGQVVADGVADTKPANDGFEPADEDTATPEAAPKTE